MLSIRRYKEEGVEGGTSHSVPLHDTLLYKACLVIQSFQNVSLLRDRRTTELEDKPESERSPPPYTHNESG